MELAEACLGAFFRRFPELSTRDPVRQVGLVGGAVRRVVRVPVGLRRRPEVSRDRSRTVRAAARKALPAAADLGDAARKTAVCARA